MADALATETGCGVVVAAADAGTGDDITVLIAEAGLSGQQVQQIVLALLRSLNEREACGCPACTAVLGRIADAAALAQRRAAAAAVLH